MTLQLPKAPKDYSADDQGNLRSSLISADGANRKKGEDVDMKGARLYLYNDDGVRFLVAINHAGTAISITPA